MHDAARMFVRSLPYHLKIGRVCEIGSRNVNGSIRFLFNTHDYVGIDIREGPNVDIVADGATWDGDGRHYDTIVCCEVLEHVSDPAALCHNIMRLLRDGGRAIITAATPEREPHSGVDGGQLQEGEHYRGVTHDDLCAWFPGCSIVVEQSPGDIYATVTKP